MWAGFESEMAQSSDAARFEVIEEKREDSSKTLDNTCPECGTDSVMTFMDRHSSHEYCGNCEWTDEADQVPVREQIGRADRRYQED